MKQQEIPEKPGPSNLQKRLFTIIFEADTPGGKAFDVALLVLIFLSVATVMLETVGEINLQFGKIFLYIEWAVTLIFTIEYILRIYAVRNKSGYIFSFYGVIDFLAIVPTYVSLLFVGAHYLLTIRALRLLRIFRLFKLGRYFVESKVLMKAMAASRPKIIVFLVSVLTIVIFIGSVLYLIEHDKDSGFTSIPKSMYWAIVTLTTVGYGDIVPVTSLGKLLASMLMITGYAIIAVPTGIVSVELAEATRQEKEVSPSSQASKSERECAKCRLFGHDADADFCRKCGHKL